MVSIWQLMDIALRPYELVRSRWESLSRQIRLWHIRITIRREILQRSYENACRRWESLFHQLRLWHATIRREIFLLFERNRALRPRVLIQLIERNLS